MQKMNFTSKQTAFDYALYMIASSYFNKAECKSKLTESNMVVHYKEQKPEVQYRMEEIGIKFMESMVRKLPTNVFGSDVIVRLRRDAANSPTEIIFENAEYIISLYGVCIGKKYKVDSRIWKKTA